MKKIISISFFAMIMAFSFSGCSSDDDVSDENIYQSLKPTKNEGYTIIFYCVFNTKHAKVRCSTKVSSITPEGVCPQNNNGKHSYTIIQRLRNLKCT